MTDNTSPVATLAARLPKGNGLTRAVEQLHGNNGALIPFIGYLEVEESGEDKNEVLKIRTSIARLELCQGDLERDAKDLLARASHAANSHPGQMTLMAEPGTAAAKAEERDRYVGYLREWQAEQTPPVSDADAGEQWNNFAGGHYGELDTAEPAFLREFLLNLGALPDQKAGDDEPDNVLRPPFAEAGDATDDTEPDDEADDDAADVES